MFCGILLSSLAVACILTCYISNERYIFSPSVHVFNDTIGLFSKKLLIKKHSYHFYFLNIDISVPS